ARRARSAALWSGTAGPWRRPRHAASDDKAEVRGRPPSPSTSRRPRARGDLLHAGEDRPQQSHLLARVAGALSRLAAAARGLAARQDLRAKLLRVDDPDQ